jgi:hypothetical protein
MLEGWRERGLVRRISGLVPAPLSPDLRAAVVQTGTGMVICRLSALFGRRQCAQGGEVLRHVPLDRGLASVVRLMHGRRQ